MMPDMHAAVLECTRYWENEATEAEVMQDEPRAEMCRMHAERCRLLARCVRKKGA